MKERGKKVAGGSVEEGERLALTGVDALPPDAVLGKFWLSGYAYRYTTGPFLLPQGAGSLDWIVLNNDSTTQKVRVTVFNCSLISGKSPLPPGPIQLTLNPGATSHNANTYTVGLVYEIQVECNSQLIFPYVSVWPGQYGEIIPGTGINSASFIRAMR